MIDASLIVMLTAVFLFALRLNKAQDFDMRKLAYFDGVIHFVGSFVSNTSNWVPQVVYHYLHLGAYRFFGIFFITQYNIVSG